MIMEWILHPPAFVLLALLAGTLLTFITSPIGTFMVWQKQSYFGATIAHSGMLGISLGLLFQVDLTFSIIFVSMLIAVFIFLFQEKSQLSNDTLLGLMAHSTLAFGLILLSINPSPQIDLTSILFGDMLSVSETDIKLLIGLLVLTALFFYRYWSRLLLISLNPQMAAIEGIPVKRIQLLYTLLLAVTIALAMKMIGVLLITSLLIIPAAAARRFSKTPEQMLGITLLIGFISVWLGMVSSIQWDLPTGPAIVIIASLIFLLSLLKKS